MSEFKEYSKKVKQDESHQPEIMYTSEGKTPDGKPFMAVKRARGYYEYAERGGQDSIAFILADKNARKFALIYESKPPMDERMNTEVRMTTAFGGSVDMDGKTLQEICQIEVQEEAGFVVPLSKIQSVGETLVSSQMSQLCHLFMVDVTDIPKTQQAEYELPDISKDQEFAGNDVIWMSYAEVLENSDWKSIFILSKVLHSV